MLRIFIVLLRLDYVVFTVILLSFLIAYRHNKYFIHDSLRKAYLKEMTKLLLWCVNPSNLTNCMLVKYDNKHAILFLMYRLRSSFLIFSQNRSPYAISSNNINLSSGHFLMEVNFGICLFTINSKSAFNEF